jgi:hypothetical protein
MGEGREKRGAKKWDREGMKGDGREDRGVIGATTDSRGTEGGGCKEEEKKDRHAV